MNIIYFRYIYIIVTHILLNLLFHFDILTADTKDVSLLMEEVEAATSSAVTSPPATATTTTNSDRKTNTTTDITSDGRGGECMGGRGRWETNAATIIPATTVTP